MVMVKTWLADRVRSIAPRTVRNLESISRMNSEFELDGPRMLLYERELREMRREIDALRREHRRVVELYDAVFDYVRAGAPAPDPAPAGETPSEAPQTGAADSSS